MNNFVAGDWNQSNTNSSYPDRPVKLYSPIKDFAICQDILQYPINFFN